MTVATRMMLNGMAGRKWPSAIELLRYSLVLAFVTAASVWAQQTDHPVTAGLIFMIGIMINGADGGLGAGLSSAVTAAFIYNFFIRFPVFAFGFSSIDDYVPLVAFNVAAAVSGGLSGRLKDRAQTAERARSHLDLLLGFSNRLQRAVTFDEVAAALHQVVSAETARSLVLPYLETHHIVRQRERWREAVDRQFGHTEPTNAEAPADCRMEFEDIDLPAFVGLLWMTIERCELLDQRAEAEVLRRSEEFKTALLSSLSHDLRTPISAISASVTSLLQFGSVLEADVHQDMLRTIQEESGRLDRFTAKLLSLGRLQGGIPASETELVDVVDALGGAVRAVRRLQPLRNILKEMPREPALVLANPAMLEQAFFNVLENAVSYSPADTGVTVRVNAGDGWISVSVVDEGFGIAPEETARVFDRFFRGEHDVRREGQGLGLSITKGFIEAFGGRVAVVSPASSGRGTEIVIALPQADAPATDHANA